MKTWHTLTIFLFFSIYSLKGSSATYTDSLQAVIRSGNSKEKAEAYFLLGNYYNPTRTDSALYCIEKSLELYHALSNKAGTMRCYGLLASIYNEIGRADTAIILGYKTLNWALKSNKSNIYAYSCLELASSYEILDNYEKAKEYYIKAVEGTYPPAALAAMANLGLYYRNHNQPDSAQYYYERALKQYLQSDTSQTMVRYNIATLYSNLASVAFLNNDPETGFTLLKKAEKIAREIDSNPLLITIYGIYAEGHLALKDYDSGVDYAKKAIEIADSYEMEFNKLDIYSVLSKLYENSGKYDSAYKYMRIYFVLKDSIQLIKYKNDLRQLEYAHSLFEKDTKIALLHQKNNNLWLAVILISVIVISVSLIVISILKRRNLKLEKARIETELQNETLARKNLKTQSELQQISEKIINQNQIIEELEKVIEGLSDNKEKKELEHKLLQLHQKKILTDRDWLEYFHLFGELYPGFYRYLRNFKDLTTGDKQQLVFIKLGFSQKEASYLLGISVEGVKRARQRLAKKLGLEHAGKLTEFVEGLNE